MPTNKRLNYARHSRSPTQRPVSWYDHQLNRSSLTGVLLLFTMEESKSTRKAHYDQLTSSFVLGLSPISMYMVRYGPKDTGQGVSQLSCLHLSTTNRSIDFTREQSLGKDNNQRPTYSIKLLNLHIELYLRYDSQFISN